ncbi:CPCC family cysteine-rich protein [Sedimentibacter sp.]|uniref:CPCC family cysteine-rich protein n=1 Tax=Sedimentibacter sp. TaxID=1960295 RepID=UPI0028AD5E62|nr:CPCC family cysteine-rich protein [Sedimentibacter sp.]
MGGRGISSGANINQVTIEQIEDRLEVDEIVKNAENVRNTAIIKDKEDERIPDLYKKCSCCGKFTIPLSSKYEKCYICGWIDDEFQNTHIYSEEGMNELCLAEAKKLYFNNK